MKKLLAAAAIFGLSATLIASASTDTLVVEQGETKKLDAFTGVTLAGGGDLKIKQGKDYKVKNISSNSEWEIELEDGTLKMKCPKPCKNKDLKATITLPKLDTLVIAGGGRIDVSGDFPNVDEMNIVIVGGGYIDADAVPSDSAEVVITGGGNISVHAKDELDVAIVGGGKVTYKGSPSIDKSILGGGLVVKD